AAGLVAQRHEPALALHHDDVALAVPDGEPLLLDQRLDLERRLGRAAQPDLDLVGMRQADLDAVRHLVEMRLEDEPHRPAALARAGPQHGLDAALLGDGARDAAVGGTAQQAEALVEVGLADAVRAAERRAALDRQMQAADGAIALDRDGGQQHGRIVARIERSEIRDRPPRISRSLSAGSPKARPGGSMRATRRARL